MAFHPLQEWPKPYRVLFNLMLVTLGIAFLLWLGMLPGWRRHRELVALVKEKEAATENMRWPKDSLLLRKRLESIQVELDGQEGKEAFRGLRQLAADAIGRSCVTFLPKILAEHISATDFMCNVTRLDYKALYNDVEAEFAGMGLKLSADRLGDAGEDGLTPVYQMVYRLWCVRRLCQLARENGLEVVKGENDEADFRSLPARSYVVEDMAEGEAVPYLLEFPTMLRLRGDIGHFRAFCGSLCTESDFLPMTALQICTVPPEKVVYDEPTVVDSLDLTVSCSAFFPAQ